MKLILMAVILIVLLGITGCSSSVQTESLVNIPNTEVLSPIHVDTSQQATKDIAVSNNDQKSASAAVINNVKKDGLKVALTFDDGPDDKYTPRILDILKKEQVKATFFIVGEHAKQHPQMMKRIVEEGHVIGNHSWDHLNLSHASTDKIQSEIVSTDDVIKQITGVVPNLFRAPYGAVSPQVVKESLSSGHQLIGWSVDTLDWDGKSVLQIVNSVRKEVSPGAISGLYASSQLRQQALSSGRFYYSSSRPDHKPTTYDEVAIANDINAACGE
ncbi:polysaccharide deacetylase family protein [Paenibacillus frigoriresistens]|uniref:polysaccharide deacetylase family protein n=1 Tax=Paenibacillus alginolyticus TaxID=59839 RepID=UPI0015676278|nr:polysaccharide deacetylase family protein [Paenibacillus frigoriresistens]NRF93205.1 polysaccharide deacetylase family protein [Paenibacillus frigoriresistens]